MEKSQNHDDSFNVCGTYRREAWAFALLAGALALLRFAHTTPDSVHYEALAAYFLGELPQEALQTPFAFRWVVPWIASWIPGVPHATAIALCSLTALALATGCFGQLLSRLVVNKQQWRTGMAVFVVSFPTFNYGSAVLTDSTGFLVLVLAAWAMLSRRFTTLAVVLAVGVGVRESTLLLLPVFWLFLLLERDFRGMVAALGITLLALAAVLLARWWFSDLPAYFWTPSWKRCLANLTRPVSWATVLLTLAPASLIATAGALNWSAIPLRTRHFILAVAFPGLALLAYSVTAAFMSGRFCWPLYLALAPLAAWRVKTPRPQTFPDPSMEKSRSTVQDSAARDWTF